MSQNQNINSSIYLKDFFTNMQNYDYWSGIETAPNSSTAWEFNTGDGYQSFAVKGNNFYAWAVRNGDVGGGGSVPETGMMGMMTIGALTWAGTRQKRRG